MTTHTDTSGHLSFDWDEDLELSHAQIMGVIEKYRPDYYAVPDFISTILSHLVNKIENDVANAYLQREIKEGRNQIGMIFHALLEDRDSEKGEE